MGSLVLPTSSALSSRALLLAAEDAMPPRTEKTGKITFRLPPSHLILVKMITAIEKKNKDGVTKCKDM